MIIKIQCPCGAKYSFEVEPVEGQMPYAVSCPVCSADGTEMANEIIATGESPSKLRLHIEEITSEAPAPREAATRPPVSTMERLRSERQRWRRTAWVLTGIALLAVAILGVWGWYIIVGSKPRLEYSVKLSDSESNTRARFLDAGTILLVSPFRAIAHDLRKGQDLWTTAFPADSAAPVDGSQLRDAVDAQSIWVCVGTRIVQLARATGEIKRTIPVKGQFQIFTPGVSNILVVSSLDETTRVAMRIDRESGQVATQEITIPRPEKFELPDEVPANVAPTSGVLLSRELDEKKERFNKPLDATSSDFYSSAGDLVELRIKLIQAKVRYVHSINEKRTVSGSMADTEGQVISDIKRSETGGVKRLDESQYEVHLRRWADGVPVEWSGRVTGRPAFFPLKTVDLLVAGGWLGVFDKQNKKLFEAKLSFPISDQFGPEKWDHQSAPALEDKGSLYFFDQGMLTAFSLPTGEVRWRATSVGVTGVHPDDAGALYVDSTTASPEDIQYSEQVAARGPEPLLLKIDPASGKVLWQAENIGQESFVAGKFLYTSSLNLGGMGMLRQLAESLNAAQPEAPYYFHIHRLNPVDGKGLWDFYRVYSEYPDGSPKEMWFQQNRFLLRFTDRIQVWKFLVF